MNISAPFVARPVATTLLTNGIALAGFFAYFRLPVSPLPQVDFPTILVQAQLPGASPDTVATSVAAPLERHLGTIADVTEMTSSSSVGTARIVLQFSLSRDINGAARDVQAAINAARADLPASLRSNPTYRKVNPADAPVLILALTSNTLTRGQVYDAASNVMGQRLSQITGIGQVLIGGAAQPAVRVELNPQPLFKYGIGLEDVRAALASANANSPKGAIEDGSKHYQLYTNDQSLSAADYKPLILAWRNGAPVKLSDVADVIDSVENVRNAGLAGDGPSGKAGGAGNGTAARAAVANAKPSVIVLLFRQPGANIIDTVDSVKAAMPELVAALPSDIQVTIANDRTTTIRAALSDTEFTLLLAVLLVTLVVFLFLRDLRATLIPAVCVPISIVGTFGAMYLLGYSLDNLSLMALTVATGFVVDDAIVVLENIQRHIDDGQSRLEAALLGERQVGFTVISISLSLIAVFIPILLMGGIVGRLFREFAVTLSLAILISMVISLTTTPMMCALLLRSKSDRQPIDDRPRRRSLFDRALGLYERTLDSALRHSALVMLILVLCIALNVALFTIIPKGFFPEEDTGRLMGGIQADQSTSFQAMQAKLTQMVSIVQHDPAVAHVVGFTGSSGFGATNTGSVFIALKSLGQRPPMDQVMAGLRRALSVVPGARLYLTPVQDIRVGGRQSNAAYQYTLQGDTTAEIYEWAPKLQAALERNKMLQDVNSDQQQKGLETDLVIDRATASRLGLTVSQVDNTLYDAFGQRQVSTIYEAQNQYHVIMEVAPRYWQSPDMLKQIYVSTAGGGASGTETTNAVVGTAQAATTANTAASIAASSARNAATNALANTGKGSASSGAAVSTSQETMVPLAAFSHYVLGNTPLAVNHQGPFVAATISFNLAPGYSLSDASTAIDQAVREIGMPASVRGSFQGTASTFQSSLASEPLLILSALVAIYIVLGVLYESLVHPITILSTLPSAGIGASLALLLFHIEFSIIALIGVILLIGIVKKNAILMIDFALDAERTRDLPPREAIFEACLKRFRPIMMTTMAAMLGAMPLALSFGDGAEMRQPLGIAIVGGLIVSQVLTLYTTPVLYLYLDRFRLAARGRWRRAYPLASGAAE